MSGKISVIHSLVQKDGKYIVLPVWVSGDTKYGNLAHPNPHANSSIGDVEQQYPHGTKFVDGDRSFFYGKVQEVYLAGKANLGLFNDNESATGTTANITWGHAGVAGDTVVHISSTTLEDTDPAEDAFAGGWLCQPGSATIPYSSYRVLASSIAGATYANEVDLTIDYGLAEDQAASITYGELNFSAYTKLRQAWTGGKDYQTCPGVTLIDCIADTWQWIQSWGPCYMLLYSAMGATISHHLMNFHEDGSAALFSGTSTRQIAGYMLPSSGAGLTMTSHLKLTVEQ